MQLLPPVGVQEEDARTEREQHDRYPERYPDKGRKSRAAIIPAPREDMRRDRDKQFEDAAREKHFALFFD
jgi:hypothetical protein